MMMSSAAGRVDDPVPVDPSLHAWELGGTKLLGTLLSTPR